MKNRACTDLNNDNSNNVKNIRNVPSNLNIQKTSSAKDIIIHVDNVSREDLSNDGSISCDIN